MKKRIPKNEPQQAPIQAVSNVQLDVKLDTPNYYSNFVFVSHTPYDLTLSFGKVPSPPTAEHIAAAKAGEPIILEAILQITMPPLLLDGLINALNEQKIKQQQTALQQERNNEEQRKQQQHGGPTSPIQ